MTIPEESYEVLEIPAQAVILICKSKLVKS